MYVTRIRNWFDIVTAEDVWESAANYKRDYNVAFSDVFTLVTAAIEELQLT